MQARGRKLRAGADIKPGAKAAPCKEKPAVSDAKEEASSQPGGPKAEGAAAGASSQEAHGVPATM